MLNRVFHLTYTDSGTVRPGSRRPSEGLSGVSLKANKRGENDCPLLLIYSIQTWEVGGEVDVPFSDMGKYLDYRLKQVAELKQITIWTARSWRDSGSKKWFEALAAVERENAKRRTKNLPQLGCFH